MIAEKNFPIVSEEQKWCRNHNLCGSAVTLSFSSNDSVELSNCTLERLFDFIMSEYDLTDSIKISVSNDLLTLGSICEFFKPVSEYTYIEFVNFVRNIRKKYPSYSLTDNTKIAVTCICVPLVEYLFCAEEVVRNMIYSCNICGTNIESPSSYESHLCYMPTIDAEKGNCFVFYDFVTMQEVVKCKKNTKIHKVNLCVAQQVCDKCNKPRKSDIPKRCESCHGGDVRVFKNEVVDSFMKFILETERPNNINTITCIAHKSQKFHAQFIFKYLIKKGHTPKFIALNDTKIMYIEISKGYQIRFIDSLNYINQNLTDFPKTFGFEDDVTKWRFPHSFNSCENQNYQGQIPDIKFYSPETMSNEKRAQFEAWYTRLRETNHQFDFQRDIVEYCKTNVEILRRGCYEFRTKFIESTTVDPFIGKGIITIAGACHKFYRKKILPKNKIGIIPTGGYRAKFKRTRESLEWLLICERETKSKIMHIGHGHEYRLPDLDILVDGFDKSTGTVYLYFDCSINGCPNCFPHLRSELVKTGKLLKRILDSGYSLKDTWSCEFEMIKADNKQFLLNHDRLYSDALNPRDAFYGSRNENAVFVRSVEEKEEIRFVDINSLYPFLNKHRKYPVGHPKIKIGHECDEYLDEVLFKNLVEGLVKCRVLPPRQLLHPVLPIHSNDKYTLIFPLCKKCSDESNTSFCTHENKSDREFTGTWVSDELKKAISMGYEITAIYEIWQYEVVEGLFTEYVNTFLKHKEEARGWHMEDDTTEKRKQYVQEYWRREGIRLDYDKMTNNKGLRRIAKHSLNCFWGKFGQKVQNNTEFGGTGDELIEIVTSQMRELRNVVPLDESNYYYQWRYTEKYNKPTEKTSVPIAVYTTAQGRLELYKYLEKLGERVLYCDTDSCVYVQRTDEEELIKPGKFLGEMTDELKRYGKGSYIREFVSSGPKFYSYVVVKPDKTEKTITKVGTVKLNSFNDHIFSHEEMKKLAKGSISIKYQSKETCRTPQHDVISKTVSRRVVKQFCKRIYPKEDESYPFGYYKKS